MVEVPSLPGSSGAGSRREAVIPDGWFELQVSGWAPQGVALELDRGTQEQRAWRRKVAALVTWAQEQYYGKAFEAENVTIAVVTQSVKRRDQLRIWTARELEARGLIRQTDEEEIFLFTCADPVTTSPLAFFTDFLWYLPQSPDPLPLLESNPEQMQRKEEPQTGVALGL